MKTLPLILSVAAFAVLGGCTTNSSVLVFGTSDTLGLTIAGGANEGGGEVTLGFKERNIAISPVIANNGTVLGANDPGDKGASDTYSVLGSFALGTNNQNITLGRFFSTGFAARELSRGFACSEATSAYGQRVNTLDPAACLDWRPAPVPGTQRAQTPAPSAQGAN